VTVPDWEVFYRAVADFSQLTKASAQAQAEFKAMGEAAKREGDQEADAARKAAIAHDEDARAIDRQAKALAALAVAQEASSKASMGGRSSMDQHLSDLQREAESTRLLNYQRQRGFTSPQQDYAYRQQEMAQRNLYNRVEQSGYANRDQYLQSLQQETQYRRALNSTWAQHAADLRDATTAAAGHADALKGTTASVGELADATTDASKIDLSGYDTAKTKVEALKTAVKDLSNEVRNANSGLSGTEFAGRLGAIQRAMKELGADPAIAKGLQPSGFGALQSSVKDLAREGSRAFDDLETTGRRTGSSLERSFRSAGSTVEDAWHAMTATARDSATEAEGFWGKTIAGIEGGFKGLATGLGSGGGIGGIFKALLSGGGMSEITNAFVGWTALILGVIQLLPMLTAGIAALGASLAALPGFLIAAGAGFGVLMEAIMPVIQAVSAYNKVIDARQMAEANPLQTQMAVAQQNKAVADAYYQVSQAAIQSANAQVTSAHSVKDAQFALAQAHYQATQTQIADAHNLQEATYTLRQAQFAASMQAMQSSMQLASAQHALTDANFQVQQSQFALNMAWQQASYSLAQLTIQVNFAQTNIRGAQLALEQAQQNYANVMAQSTSTALQRAQAANEIKQAEEALQQTVLDAHHNEQQLADVRKYGKDQMFGVTQAQHALYDAQFQQIQAQKQLVITEKEAANAQIQAAHAIVDAIYGVGQAQRQQRNDALVSAHNISDAQFALQQAYFNQSQSFVQGAHQQQDAAFQLQQALAQKQLGLPQVASAMAQYNASLADLGPAGREAVSILGKLAYWWQENHKVSEAFWKAVDPALEKLPGLLKPIGDFLDATASAMGGVVGDLINKFDQFAHSPAWNVITNETVNIIKDIGTGLCAIADAFGTIAVVAAPFTQHVAGLITSFFVHFDNWINSAAKSGEMKKFLDDTFCVLQAIAHLGGAVLKFFEDLMGNTAAARHRNMQEFVKLLNSLANVVLPSLLTILQTLSQPKLADAMINLMNAVTKMLAAIVASPAFAQTVSLLLQGLAGVMNIVAKIATLPGVGDVLGVIAGTFTTLAILRFTHLMDLLGLLFKLPGLKQGLQWLKDILPDWITGSASGVVAGGKTAAATIEAAMVSGGEQAAAEIRAAMTGLPPGGGKPGEPGPPVPGPGGAPGEAERAPWWKRIFPTLFGGEGLGLGATAAIGLANLFPSLTDKNKTLWQSDLQSFNQYFATPIHNFFGTGLPNLFTKTHHGWSGFATEANNEWSNWIEKPIQSFLGVGLPGLFTGNRKGWSGFATEANNEWRNWIESPIQSFLGQGLPNLMGANGKGWSGLWDQGKTTWHNDIWSPIYGFFGQDLPNWFGGGGKGWKGLWDTAKSLWHDDIISPFSTFFTQTIPGWFSNIKKIWDTLWGDAKSLFHQYIMTPIANWFTKTLPDMIVSGFKSAVNTVIRDVINKAIHYINDVTHVVGIPPIKPVPQLAGGGGVPKLAVGGAVHSGSIPGAGDGDTQVIMAEPGEYMIRKAARMAIDRAMGTDFLPRLNHAEKTLGYIAGGPVGPAAGGLANPIGHGLSPERVDMGVDYAGRGPLFAIGAGTIVNLYNAGWPGGTFIGERLSPSFGSGYWYLAEDIVPQVRIGERVQAGQHVADAWGGPSGIEVGWAAPPGTGQTMAAQVGQAKAGQAHGDPGLYPTGWGVSASNLIGSLGGPRGIIDGPVQGTPGGGLFGWFTSLGKGILHALGGAAKHVEQFLASGVVKPAFDLAWNDLVQPLVNKVLPEPMSGPKALGRYAMGSIKRGIDTILGNIDKQDRKAAMAGPQSTGFYVNLGRQLAGSFEPGWGSGPQFADLNSLWTKESGWNRFASNPTSGAFGIPQALPYTKMPKAAWPINAGGDADATAQIIWGLGYIKDTYGDPMGAWQHELMHNWYQVGGSVGDHDHDRDDRHHPHHPAHHRHRTHHRPHHHHRHRTPGEHFPDWHTYPEHGGSHWDREFARLSLAWQAGRSELFELAQRPHWKTRAERRTADVLKLNATPWVASWRALSRDPEDITSAEWGQLRRQTNLMAHQLAAAGGRGRDRTSRAGLRYTHPIWYHSAVRAMDALQKEEAAAFSVWAGAGSRQTPGPLPRPLPPPISPSSRIPDILSLITGGPGEGFYAGGGSVTSPTLGLAIGGGNYQLGGAIFPAPRYSDGEAPNRQLSAAGAAGQGGVGAGPLFRDIIVHNPAAEPAGASITRNVTRLGFLAGRGPV
jgi:hypothetical protein